MELANLLFSLGTIIAQGAVVLITALLFLYRGREHFILSYLGRHGLFIAFLIALSTTLATLFYSVVIGFEVCPLCWWQRVALYPQVILLGLALWKRATHIVDYALPLLSLGALVALFQSFLQMGFFASALPCAAVGGTSCATRLVFEFGYITIPLMSLTIFLLMIVILLCVRRAFPSTTTL